MTHALMQRWTETIYVPPEKVQAFLADGWKVVKEAEVEPKKSPMEQPKAEEGISAEEAARTLGKKKKE